MEWLNQLEMFNAVMVCIAVTLIAKPHILGIWLMQIAQIGWIVFAYHKGHEFFLYQSIFLFCMNAYAIYSWTRKRVGMKPAGVTQR